MALREAFEGCLSKLGLIRTVIVLLQLSHSCRQTDAGRLQTYRICIAFDLNYMIFFSLRQAGQQRVLQNFAVSNKC